jgi:hypothetical protein
MIAAMGNKRPARRLAFAVLLLAVTAGRAQQAPPPGHEQYSVPPPPLSDGIFPCMECHRDRKTNPQRRVLTEMHDDIVLHHDEGNRWCLDCHDAVDRDWLHLANGRRVSFSESYTLCGQCHGDKLRDWKAGAHGKRTGSWNGRKQYLLCAHCHNPHAPRFAPLAPLPPPDRPLTGKGPTP